VCGVGVEAPPPLIVKSIVSKQAWLDQYTYLNYVKDMCVYGGRIILHIHDSSSCSL
jgi:hypothetical protein